MWFCDFRHLFGKSSMSWLRSKHVVQECWSHNAVHMSIQSNQSVELTNTSTERPVYAPNTSRQLSTHCIKCSPSNFKIQTLITLLSASNGWCFVCFFKGNMKASELKNPNKPNKKPMPTTPPSKTDPVQFHNTLVSFTEQKNILRLLKICASKITCPRWF